MIDLSTLAQKIQELGIMNKPFFDCTKEEIEGLCESVMSSMDSTIPPEGWDRPRIVAGELIITFRSHPKYHWWTPDGQGLIDTLIELSADWDVARKYLDERRISETEYLNMLIPF